MNKCKECKQPFEPLRPLQYICSIPCSIEYSKKKQKAKEKEFFKKLKEKSKSTKDYKKDLQIIFNTYIRQRDKDLPCVSCGTYTASEYHAGHYIPTTYQYLRFNENNVHKQCSKCNTHLSGNLTNYRIELIKRIGLEEVERLEKDKHKQFKLSVVELKILIKQYKEKVKLLK